MPYRDQPARREGPGPALPQLARDLDLPAGAVPSDAAEANWENEGGRLRRATRLDPDSAPRRAPGAEPEAHPLGLRATTRHGTERNEMTTRPGVRVGRIYEPRTPEAGSRVLVDRVWPRGLAKDAADLDEWCKDVAPSTALRRWYGHDPSRFDEFGRRYRAELDQPGPAGALNHLRLLAQEHTLTLLTATRHPEISQAAVLANLLDPESRPC